MESGRVESWTQGYLTSKSISPSVSTMRQLSPFPRNDRIEAHSAYPLLWSNFFYNYFNFIMKTIGEICMTQLIATLRILDFFLKIV